MRLHSGVLGSPLRILFVLAALAIAATASASPVSNGGKDFDIDLPAGCTLLKRSLHMPDFDVYDVLCRGRQIGGVYVGNAPNALVKGRLIKTGRPFPAFIQIWTSDKPDDPAVADRIMASVRLHAAD